MLNKIALVQMWPEIKAAEDEVIARITNSCKSLGVEVVLINTTGRLVTSPETKITSKDVDFVIHLHFETPKTYDAFSFVTLWNPLQFYFDWGYRKFSNNIVSHDDFLSCDSACADDHVRRQILSDQTHLEPHFNLFHSLSTPICKPSLGNKKLFYVGINWDKLGKGKGRHQDLLQALDKSGELVIYGPDLFQGVDVWEGFKSYVGPLPFDGESVIRAIDDAGITLVLSSEAHIESELMSNRLFEGLAAGSVIIVDENKFAQKHFGDTLLYIKTEGVEPEDITSQVRDHLKWINIHQDQAIEMATKAQQIFKDKFDMALSIRKIYKELPKRKQQLSDSYLHKTTQHSLTIIGLLKAYNQDDLHIIIDNFSKQTYENKKLILLVDKHEYKQNKKQIEKAFQDNDAITLQCINLFKRDRANHIISDKKIGPFIATILSELSEGELVSILPYNESLFSEHYSSLIRAFEDNEDLDVAYSNILLTHQNESQKWFFDLKDKIRPFAQDYNSPNGFSRFLVKVKHEDWMGSTLKYLGWGVMDAIYSKSKKRSKVARSSCTIDIQNLLWQPTAMPYFDNDKILTIDSMDMGERQSFSLENISTQHLSGILESKINLDNYTIPERRRIITRLFEALGLPRWMNTGTKRLYRLLSKP